MQVRNRRSKVKGMVEILVIGRRKYEVVEDWEKSTKLQGRVKHLYVEEKRRCCLSTKKIQEKGFPGYGWKRCFGNSTLLYFCWLDT